EQYASAGRHFAGEGQFIKAIAAFKVILEMDPGNAAAREQLSTMNGRRRSRPAPASSRAKATPAPSAKQVEPIELPPDDAPAANKVKTGETPDYGKELVFDAKAEKFSTGKRTKYVIVPSPPAALVEAVSGKGDADHIERLPTDAIVGTADEDPTSRP